MVGLEPKALDTKRLLLSLNRRRRWLSAAGRKTAEMNFGGGSLSERHVVVVRAGREHLFANAFAVLRGLF